MQLAKFTSNLREHKEAREVIDKILEQAVPYFKEVVLLPSKISNVTPDILFSSAAVIRAHLDRVATILTSIMALRVMVKKAKQFADLEYKESLTVVYSKGHEAITKARGFEEKELLARFHMSPDIKDNFEFWKNAISDIDDIIGLLKLKINTFQGELDTLLSQIALLKIAVQNRNLVLTADDLDKLEGLAKSKSTSPNEGVWSFHD